MPTWSSRKATARLTAAGERPSLRAAPARLPSSSAATKTFMASMRSIDYSASCNTECRTIGIQSNCSRIRTSGPPRLEERLARDCPNEAPRLGLVVVVVHAGADERVQSARGQIECGRARRAGHVDVDVHRGEALARLARRFAVLQEGDDPALLHAEIVHADTRSLRELLAQQRTERC